MHRRGHMWKHLRSARLVERDAGFRLAVEFVEQKAEGPDRGKIGLVAEVERVDRAIPEDSLTRCQQLQAARLGGACPAFVEQRAEFRESPAMLHVALRPIETL